MKAPTIATFYTPQQVLEFAALENTSWSPLKPRLLMEFLKEQGLGAFLEIHDDFPPMTDEDFKIAHNAEYIEAFFVGREPLASSNYLNWSAELARTVRFTNASLYAAIRWAVENPTQVTFSPTSGFHHARPGSGRGFCTFSGQVIASVKIFRELRLRGAYLDLDGHFGNSIEDSRGFVPDLNEAIPEGCNINPLGEHAGYVRSFQSRLDTLAEQVSEREIDYVVFCHGADSHEADDLGGQCTTNEWLDCSRRFYEWVARVEEQIAAPLPVTLSLFGGYRRDDYRSVLSLHTADLAICLRQLCGADVEYQPQVSDRHYGH